MFRACRLVVDTGIHALGWTREQAIQFFQGTNFNSRIVSYSAENTPMGQTDIESEIDRYIAWPGMSYFSNAEVLRTGAGLQIG